MSLKDPIRTGAALSITAGIAYAACTFLFWLWPDAAAAFMNGLFHGLDFRRLQVGPALFSFGSFAYALAVLMAWAFILGTLFGWLRQRTGGEAGRA